MSNRVPSQTLPDETSFVIPLSNYNTYGLCQNYTLRRHKWEAEANAGCYEARRDWIKYIGPSKEFGGCNPVNGNFTATVMPLTRPERLGLIAYVIECTNYSQPYIYNTELAWPILHQLAYYISDAFLYDTVLELEQPNLVSRDPDTLLISFNLLTWDVVLQSTLTTITLMIPSVKSGSI
jgi:hypothetical protein